MSSCRPVRQRRQQVGPLLPGNDVTPPDCEVLGEEGARSLGKEELGSKGTILQYFSNEDDLRIVVENYEIENDGTGGRKRGRDEDEIQLASKKHKFAKIPIMKLDLEGERLTLGGTKSISRECPRKRKYISRKNKTIIQIKGQKKLLDCWKSQGKPRIHS